MRDINSRFFHTLTENGWLPDFAREDEENDAYSYYVLTLIGQSYQSKCTAVVSTSKDGIDEQGHLGVVWVEVEYENDDRPHHYGDLLDMQRAIECAEMNLLKIGVPFVDNNCFHGTAEEIKVKKALNTKLREEWNIDEIEKQIMEE